MLMTDVDSLGGCLWAVEAGGGDGWFLVWVILGGALFSVH